MKKKEKKMILGIIIVGVVIVGIIWLATRNKGEENKPAEQVTAKEEFVQVLDDGTKLNTSSKLNQDKKLGDLSVGNIQFTYKDGVSVVLANVTNKGNKATSLKMVELTLLNKDGSKIETLEGLIAPLQPGASTQLNMGATSDIANAYDFTIREK